MARIRSIFPPVFQMAHPGSVGGQHNGYCEPVLGREGILSIENQHFNVDCSENTDKMSTDASIPDQSVEELPGELDKGESGVDVFEHIRPGQNVCRFVDDILKFILLNETLDFFF